MICFILTRKQLDGTKEEEMNGKRKSWKGSEKFSKAKFVCHAWNVGYNVMEQRKKKLMGNETGEREWKMQEQNGM